MEFYDAANIRPNIGLGNAICGYAIIWKHAICAGDEALIWSNTYMGFSPAFNSSFEFLLLQEPGSRRLTSLSCYIMLLL